MPAVPLPEEVRALVDAALATLADRLAGHDLALQRCAMDAGIPAAERTRIRQRHQQLTKLRLRLEVLRGRDPTPTEANQAVGEILADWRPLLRLETQPPKED
jgi:hypothetical protein